MSQSRTLSAAKIATKRRPSGCIGLITADRMD